MNIDALVAPYSMCNHANAARARTRISCAHRPVRCAYTADDRMRNPSLVACGGRRSSHLFFIPNDRRIPYFQPQAGTSAPFPTLQWLARRVPGRTPGVGYLAWPSSVHLLAALLHSSLLHCLPLPGPSSRRTMPCCQGMWPCSS